MHAKRLGNKAGRSPEQQHETDDRATYGQVMGTIVSGVDLICVPL
ncbi:MAG: hypothetical protein P8X86_12555 [Desulfofustis sp.]